MIFLILDFEKPRWYALERRFKKGQQIIINDRRYARPADRAFEPKPGSERRKERQVAEVVMGRTFDGDHTERFRNVRDESVKELVIAAIHIICPALAEHEERGLWHAVFENLH